MWSRLQTILSPDSSSCAGKRKHDVLEKDLERMAGELSARNASTAKAINIGKENEICKASASPDSVLDLSPAPNHGDAFVCERPDQWLNPESYKHNALLIKRPLKDPARQKELQPIIDRALASGKYGNNGGEADMIKTVMNGTRAELEGRMRATTQEFLSVLELPAHVAQLIQDDAAAIGAAVGTLCPFSPFLEVRLEIMGENVCSRWHQDKYTGRAIVSYTGGDGKGTMYTPDSNVDFWELKNCGNNECILHDKAAVHAIDVGDILFIKGTGFPTGPAGLVHKSADKCYHPDGRIVARLVLKVDVHLPERGFLDAQSRGLTQIPVF